MRRPEARLGLVRGRGGGAGGVRQRPQRQLARQRAHGQQRARQQRQRRRAARAARAHRRHGRRRRGRALRAAHAYTAILFVPGGNFLMENTLYGM